MADNSKRNHLHMEESTPCTCIWLPSICNQWSFCAFKLYILILNFIFDLIGFVVFDHLSYNDIRSLTLAAGRNKKVLWFRIKLRLVVHYIGTSIWHIYLVEFLIIFFQHVNNFKMSSTTAKFLSRSFIWVTCIVSHFTPRVCTAPDLPTFQTISEPAGSGKCWSQINAHKLAVIQWAVIQWQWSMKQRFWLPMFCVRL